MLLRATAGLFAAALVVPVFAGPPAVPVSAPVRAPEKAPPDRGDIGKQLGTRVTLEKGFTGTFREAAAMLATAYDLTLVLDARFGAKMDDEQPPVENQPVKLPKLTNVRLSTVLDLIGEQVRGKALVYPDHVKLVPLAHWAYESGVLSTEPNPYEADTVQLLPTEEMLRAKPLTHRATVNLTFRAKPLSEALEEIVEASGANVALAPAVPAAVRAAPVTARFANVPVAVAVRTLCELSDTGVIEDGNVLVVTTRERAAARAKEDLQKRRDREPVLPPGAGFGFAGGFGGGGGTPGAIVLPPDLTADVQKLRDQNEQLRKELEELKKALKK
jgi:hypothetical protein